MSEVTSYMGLRGPALSSVIGATAGLAFFLFGYDQGDLAGLLTVPSSRRQFPQADTIRFPDSAHVANLQGLTIGIWNLGCFFSAILTILIGDKIGRKKSVQLGSIIAIWGCSMQAGAINFACMLIGRIISGFGVGLLSCVYYYLVRFEFKRLRYTERLFQYTRVKYHLRTM